ncbi:ATP-binding cassette domain-containing protein [Methanofollis formosanus]|uniref:ATP-binding cassette domain-containing protein n=1 Tax=Methanofollis formosanus TaxID=299308 RepID=A0A8G1EGH6_9EURY|nr:ATP-binding cassette domain-containing protein [Methanofollis formosanus]QYZ79184.1 ATP-binding cassette domain-containing protein [Methanofollis formosanus]
MEATIPDIIEVEAFSHRFNTFTAVDRITFSVRRGEIFSLLGPNGAGKSTTINVLTTLLPLQDGRVRVAGHNVASDQAAVRRSIGIVFQNEVLDRDLTVRETLEFHGRLYAMPREERTARIEELMDVVDLTEKRDVRTKYLSGGMRRRLEIARGLMTRPDVLFLDEPTIGLDPQTRIRIWEYIRRVNEEGTTIFLTTHYMDEADRLSDRIGIIDHGRIIAGGTPDELKNTLGNDMIYMETDNNDRAAALLGGVENIHSIRTVGNGITAVTNEDGTRCLPKIFDTLSTDGIGLAAVNLKKPSMDDVFIHYTGRAIREEDTGKVHPHQRRRR